MHRVSEHREEDEDDYDNHNLRKAHHPNQEDENVIVSEESEELRRNSNKHPIIKILVPASNQEDALKTTLSNQWTTNDDE